MAKSLEKELNYYIKHQDELVEKYEGRVIVIKGHEVLGEFDNELEALEETSKDHKPGTFFIIRCEPGEDRYKQVFHSRVSFA